jgi:hypothetical protein
MIAIWMKSALETARFYQEVQQVIGLRMMRIARGGSASQRETCRMITEKGFALTEAAASLASGASMKKVARRYRSHVRANQRRLSR